MRYWYVLFLVAIALGVTPQRQAHAGSNCIQRPETCIDTTFLPFWQAHGGLDQFGNSITGKYARTVDNDTFYVQEFERVRLEYFPKREAPHNIVIGRVGAEWLDYHIKELTPLTTADTAFAPESGACAVVEVNRPAVCGAFLQYHNTHGAELDGIPFANRNERLRLFGAPLTPAMRWNNGTTSIVVQVFERARFEYHPNDPAGKTVQMGKVHAENTLSGVPAPIGASPAVNYLTDTGVTIVPTSVTDVFRKNMPFVGFWQHQASGLKFAATDFRYLDSFYSIPAPEGKKWLTFTVLMQNQRAGDQAPVYIDHSYIAIIDLEGNRHTAAAPIRKLDLPVVPTTVYPGGQMVGQMLLLIPEGTGVAQVEFNGANLDQYVSRLNTVMEIRVAPFVY